MENAAVNVSVQRLLFGGIYRAAETYGERLDGP